MSTCGSELGAGADIILGDHWDLGGGGEKRRIGSWGHKSNYCLLHFGLLGFYWVV